MCPWCFRCTKHEDYAAAGDNQLNPSFIILVACQVRRGDGFPTVSDPAHRDVFARSNTSLGGKRQVHWCPKSPQSLQVSVSQHHILSAWNPWFTETTMWKDKTTRGWVEGFVLWSKFSRTEAAAHSFPEYFFSWLFFWFLNLSSAKSSKIFRRKILQRF